MRSRGQVLRTQTFPSRCSQTLPSVRAPPNSTTLFEVFRCWPYQAAGLTAPELEQALLKAYGDQLVMKEVSVVVQTSVFKVFVTGAVLKPGPIISERVETPLEAVIEAGIDTTKSNLKKIVVIREHDDGKTERFKLNLDDVMKGKPTVPFILKSMDKIYVPEKFAWF